MNRKVLRRIGEMLEEERPVVDGPVLEIGVIRGGSAVHEVPALRDRPAVVVDLFRDGGPGVQGDARSLPFADSSFGVVVCTSVLEHVPDWWRVLGELYRVLVPWGTLLVSVPGYSRERTVRLGAVPGLRGSVAPTFGVHLAPVDCYRFGLDAMRDVVLAGCRCGRVEPVRWAPTFVAIGLKDPGRWREALASVGVPA